MHAYVTLEETRDSRRWIIQHCPFCGSRHQHGAGALNEDPRQLLGHRSTHCVTHSNGYILTTNREDHGKEMCIQ
jgi:hypothetical protein